MVNRTYFVFPTAALALCVTSQAIADVAPPATYVEQCTVEKQVTKDNECIACKAIRFGEGLGRCEKLLAPYCYNKVCDSWGGTVYTEVFCRAKTQSGISVPQSIINQLNVYDAPKLDGEAGGAANCVSPPSTGTGGSPSQTTPSQTTPSQTTPIQTTVPVHEILEETGWCSVSRAVGTSSAFSFGVLGLLGVMLVRSRRKSA